MKFRRIGTADFILFLFLGGDGGDVVKKSLFYIKKILFFSKI